MTMSRRALLGLGAAALGAAAIEPRRAESQAPKRGGTLTIRAWDPPLFDQMLTTAYILKAVDRVEAVDRYTVKCTLKEPFSWFLDVLANPMSVAIVAHECVEKFGDLKKAEAVVGTGPWMLDSYRPNVGLTLVRNPNYFVPGLPYIDRVEVVVDEDNASRMAAFLAGKYDLRYELPAAIYRTDWVQIKDTLKQKRPNLRVLEFPSNGETHIPMRTDRPPFND